MQRYNNHAVQMLAPIHSPLVPQLQPLMTSLCIHQFILLQPVCTLRSHPSLSFRHLVNDGDLGWSCLKTLFITHDKAKPL